MAGPTASILFVSRATTPLEIARSAMLATGDVRGAGTDLWIEQRPFLVSTGPEYPEDLADLGASGLPQLLGWMPAEVVSFAAMCNDARDHHLLARLCLAVCEQTGGIVDFGGALPFGPELEDGAPSAARRIVNPQGLDGGALFAVSYLIAAGSFGTTHLGDADLLRAWLAHPDFRMVK